MQLDWKRIPKKNLEILIIVHKSHPASILHTITSLPLITTAHYLSLIYQDMSVVVAVIRLRTVSISKPVEGNMTRYASAAAIKPTCSATNVFGPRPPSTQLHRTSQFPCMQNEPSSKNDKLHGLQAAQTPTQRVRARESIEMSQLDKTLLKSCHRWSYFHADSRHDPLIALCGLVLWDVRWVRPPSCPEIDWILMSFCCRCWCLCCWIFDIYAFEFLRKLIHDYQQDYQTTLQNLLNLKIVLLFYESTMIKWASLK